MADCYPYSIIPRPPKPGPDPQSSIDLPRIQPVCPDPFLLLLIPFIERVTSFGGSGFSA